MPQIHLNKKALLRGFRDWRNGVESIEELCEATGVDMLYMCTFPSKICVEECLGLGKWWSRCLSAGPQVTIKKPTFPNVAMCTYRITTECVLKNREIWDEWLELRHKESRHLSWRMCTPHCTLYGLIPTWWHQPSTPILWQDTAITIIIKKKPAGIKWIYQQRAGGLLCLDYEFLSMFDHMGTWYLRNNLERMSSKFPQTSAWSQGCTD